MMDVIYLPLGGALAAIRRLEDGGGSTDAAPPAPPSAPREPVRAPAPVDVVQVSAESLAKGKAAAPPPPVVVVAPAVAAAPPAAAAATASSGAAAQASVVVSAQAAYEANLVTVDVYQLEVDLQLKILA